jgi:hypothetical protein
VSDYDNVYQRALGEYTGSKLPTRCCVHCASSIPLDVLVRARWKAIFCSQSCRDADKVAIRRRRNEHRRERGQCPTCGSHRAKARRRIAVNAV